MFLGQSGPHPPKTMDDERADIVERSMWVGADSDEETKQRSKGRSLAPFLFNEVATEAQSYAVANGLSVAEFATLAWQGIEVVQMLQFGVTDTSKFVTYNRNVDFWSHNSRPVVAVQKGEKPVIRQDAVESAAFDYLRLLYRARNFARVLVDVTIAAHGIAGCQGAPNPYRSAKTRRSKSCRHQHFARRTASRRQRHIRQT